MELNFIPDVHLTQQNPDTALRIRALLEQEYAIRAAGADLRIMTFNVLADAWSDNAIETIQSRVACGAAILSSYRPDVVGLQEATETWHSALQTQLRGHYAIAGGTVQGEYNLSAIAYNTETTELLDSQAIAYSDGNDFRLRNLTWAHLRRKSDAKEYIVTSTHWDITHDRRVIQCSENADLVKALYAKYRVPVFSAGDYNVGEEGLFHEFLAKAQMHDAKYMAKVMAQSCGSCHPLCSDVPYDDDCIDHIAVTSEAEILYYSNIRCPAALEASDHYPVYIDVKL